MDRLSLLLIDGTQVGPFVQQQLNHLQDKLKELYCKENTMSFKNKENHLSLTSWKPLCAAWCRAVLPLRSAMFTLLSWVSRASAQREARLAAATCRGVCQNLSRAFASAPRLSSRPTALWEEGSNHHSLRCISHLQLPTFNLVQFMSVQV